MFRESVVAKLTSRHPYKTHNNKKILIDQLEQNQDAIRKDMITMRSQMDQLMEVVQNLARGQEETRQANLRVVAANLVVTLPVNPVGGNGAPNYNRTTTCRCPYQSK